MSFLVAPDALKTDNLKAWKSTSLRACTLAHRLAWRAAWKTGAESVIVFEDDVVLCASFKSRLEALELPADWQICYFGCVFHTMPEILGDGVVRLTGTSWDAHGYMIRKPFAKFLDSEYGKVSRATFPRPMDRELANDTIMADYHGQFPAYGVWPPMAWQVAGLSNNANCVRGNYHPDGRPNLFEEIVVALDTAHGIETPVRAPRVAKPQPVTRLSGGEVSMTGRVSDFSSEMGRAGQAEPKDDDYRKCGPLVPPSRNACRKRGLLISPYSVASERMALALVKSIRRVNASLPIHILAQDYICTERWKGWAVPKSVRAREAKGTEGHWMNKVAALQKTPFEETIFLDCDVVMLRDPEPWFDRLGTDDFTFFNLRLNPVVAPDRMEWNMPNPHRMQEIHGVPETPVIAGGGHYFLRRGARGGSLLSKMMEILDEALECGPASRYGKVAGAGNLPAADEIAASLLAVEEHILLPEPQKGTSPPIAVFMPPHQQEDSFDLAAGKASFFCDWSGQVLTPDAVHFCHDGKHFPPYLKFIKSMNS